MEKINKDKYRNLVNGQYNISLLLTYYETKHNVIKSHNAILLEKKRRVYTTGKQILRADQDKNNHISAKPKYDK